MSRVWIAILVLLLALAGASLWLHRSLSDAREQLGAMVVQAEAREARLAALEARLGALGRDIQAINQRSAQNERRVQEALRRNPDWSRNPVPPDVADGLCAFADCAGRDPAGQM